jgi:ubiquinone biosynthesis protein COQ4
MNLFLKTYHYLRLSWATIRINLHPERTNLYFIISDSLFKLEKFQELDRIMQSNPEARKIIEKKIVLKFSIEELAEFPLGTLGKAYADHMVRAKLKFDFFPRPKDLTDKTYVFFRTRQTHDLMHVVTGFDTSPIGESCLQSFMLAQMGSPVQIVLIGSSILFYAFINQEHLFKEMDGIAKGWKMGREAKTLFTYDWASALSKDLNLVRKELNILLN